MPTTPQRNDMYPPAAGNIALDQLQQRNGVPLLPLGPNPSPVTPSMIRQLDAELR